MIFQKNIIYLYFNHLNKKVKVLEFIKPWLQWTKHRTIVFFDAIDYKVNKKPKNQWIKLFRLLKDKNICQS